MTKGRFSRLGRSVALLGVAGLLMVPPAASGIEMDALYTVEVPFDPSDPEAQNTAYERALEAVLIRVTGSEAAAESDDLRGLFPTPARYVLQYQRGDNDTLIVALDGPAIVSLLRRAGQPVWGNDRPLTLIWLAVDWGLGEREIVAADDAEDASAASRSIDRNRLLRERVLASAKRRGIPVLFPLLDVEDLQSVSFSDIWGGFDDELIDASRRYGTNSVLVGRVRADEPYRDRWSYYSGGQQLQWTGGPETAINLLADALAEQFAYAGDAPVETVILTISGVDSVSAYGTLQRFLGELSVIDSYQIDRAAADEIRFRVQVQGGTDRLASALEFSGILERRDWLDAGDYFSGRDAGNTLDYAYRRFLPGGAGPDDDPSNREANAPSAAETY